MKFYSSYFIQKEEKIEGQIREEKKEEKTKEGKKRPKEDTIKQQTKMEYWNWKDLFGCD